MLHNYQTKDFGNRIRDIRKGLNLSQQDVSDLSGVNLDTLRKIENGYVVPRYDTLEILSIAYRTDLLETFKNYRFTSDLYEIYNMLDRYIVDYQVDKLGDIKNKIDNLDGEIYSTIILASEINKLGLLVDGIYYFNKSDTDKSTNNLEKARDYLIGAICVHNEEFELEKVTTYKYNFFDVRILVILAVVLCKLGDGEISNEILCFILEIVDKSPHASFLEKLLVIKIYSNISYNYYLMDDPENTLVYSEDGIKYAQNNNLLYGLSTLFWRKGIAMMKMGQDGYIESIRKSINVLDIQENHQLKEVYLNVLKKKYDIEL
ncbi:MAG: helix-turn-helix transcriptional regulator [Eubacteriales bacterium]